MAVYDYRQETFSKAIVCGKECDYSDMRIDRASVPEGKFQYEVAHDDEGIGDPARIKKDVMVNFLGTIICDRPLPLGEDGVLWIEDGDFCWV